IAELEEAKQSSDKVGDMILNQSIYRNLSDNYLALQDLDLYKMNYQFYLDLQEQIVLKERFTIDSSISKFIEEDQAFTEEKINNLKNFIWVTSVLLILSVILLFIKILKMYKRFSEAKKELSKLSE